MGNVVFSVEICSSYCLELGCGFILFLCFNVYRICVCSYQDLYFCRNRRCWRNSSLSGVWNSGSESMFSFFSKVVVRRMRFFRRLRRCVSGKVGFGLLGFRIRIKGGASKLFQLYFSGLGFFIEFLVQFFFLGNLIQIVQNFVKFF